MVCGSCRTFLIAPFLRRIYAVTDTVIASARPGTADETITNGRAMLAPTGCGARLSIALALREATMVLSVVPNRETAITVSVGAAKRL